MKKKFYEVLQKVLNRFKAATHGALMLILFCVAAFLLGIALIPSVFLMTFTFQQTANLALYLKISFLALGAGISFFIFGFTLLLVLPVANRLMHAYPKPMRGPYYTANFLKWIIHNAMTYLARYTFLEFITPSPFNNWFYRRMGMRVGEHTQINTTHISDPCLIEIGSYVTIGGSATIVAHYGQGGFLIILPVVIKDKATIGLRAIIMGGCEIGVGAKILPNSVVLPKTKVPDRETWGGVPAQKISITPTRPPQTE